MPLVRVEVRNEYGLGAPEMYREANKEEPKEILEGVAVAGLVGVLRQLGDLADFAAEVFHGLQEEVMITSSRSHKLMGRVQRVEAAVSPIEKAVLAQRSHLHFAYTAGSNWHAHIRCEKNHFVYTDVPQFILDSYEDCHGPPRLHLLDRFDPGGPGSCLKRYSDPTFFRRASVTSGQATSEKVSKDKKGHKIKKRRSWSRNGEVSRGASLSDQCGRMQFTQLKLGVHSHPVSTYDATLRSDLSQQSNLELRNRSGYSKDDFHPSYSTQPKEQESRDFISSPVEKVTDASDDIRITLTQEQGGRSSYSVTCDERTAMLEPTVQDYDHEDMRQEGDRDRNLESFSPKLDLETLVDNAVNFETVDKMDVQNCTQALPTTETGDIHLDDFESETDDFMDALNTIEPESEMEIDCTRTKDVDNNSKLEDKAAEDGLPPLVDHNLECQTSNSESNVLANGSLLNGSCGHTSISVSPKSPSAACYSTSRVPAKDECNSMFPVDKPLLTAQRAGDSLIPGGPQSLDSSGNGDSNNGTNIESVSCTVSSNVRDGRSVMPTIGDTRSSQSQKPAPEASNVTSVTFWTNGNLLGLQPSKPPDCNVVNDLPQDRLSKRDGKIISSSQHLILSDKDLGKPDNTENIEEGLDTDSSTCQDYQESSISFRRTSWKISPADLDIKLGKVGNLLYPSNASFTGARVTASGSEFQAAKEHPEITRSSSRMFEFSNRLLTTGSNKKLLHGEDENSRHVSYQNANASEQKNHQNFACQTFYGQTKDFSGGESLILSPTSSPPLAHMKISFQPIGGFETSKLKLKFPDGNSNDETSIDTFTSFQLVPETSIIQQNVGSDSDDDTFYRSSPALSDDFHSHQPESDSEQWETGESPSSKDPDLYDSLRGISLTESVSTVLGNGRICHGETHENCGVQFAFVENSRQNSHSCCSFDLQSLDILKHSFQEELRKDNNSRDLVKPEFAITLDPPPPPPPPVQWWSMKPHQDDIEDRCEVMPKGSNYAFDPKHSPSKISQQPKPAPFSHDQLLETTNEQKSKQFGPQKSSGRREANQGKSIIDEKEDFLHQIRTKSFNLRPVVPARPTLPSGGSSNIQVTAILEKANAIRQAVGSDDDGDWSDT